MWAQPDIGAGPGCGAGTYGAQAVMPSAAIDHSIGSGPTGAVGAADFAASAGQAASAAARMPSHPPVTAASAP